MRERDVGKGRAGMGRDGGGQPVRAGRDREGHSQTRFEPIGRIPEPPLPGPALPYALPSCLSSAPPSPSLPTSPMPHSKPHPEFDSS